MSSATAALQIRLSITAISIRCTIWKEICKTKIRTLSSAITSGSAASVSSSKAPDWATAASFRQAPTQARRFRRIRWSPATRDALVRRDVVWAVKDKPELKSLFPLSADDEDGMRAFYERAYEVTPTIKHRKGCRLLNRLRVFWALFSAK